ncbi:MAG TPA: PIF1 family DEAD/DEAH box helicase [Candidatus Nitrosocosmicus sp.]|nr:PIF1 family DEAD/DEAH box helicase [Candidatus Nitrosocosmicus sp.]
MQIIKKISSLLSTPDDKKLIITPELENSLGLFEFSNTNLFITGKAGTGKSTLVKFIREKSKKKIVVLAPTGLAALNVGGQTVHSFFGFPPKLITRDSIYKARYDLLYKQVDTIIIDEASILRADLLDGIDYFLRVNGRDISRPFGGVQIVLVGDLYQLPPVVSTNERETYFKYYDSPYFFSAKTFMDAGFKTIELMHIFRQKDDEFISLLNKIRNAEATYDDMQILNQQVISESLMTYPKPVTLATTNRVVNNINLEELSQIDNPTHRYEAEIEGDFPTKEGGLPVELELTLKVGARVLFLKNDVDKKWVNGSLGTVSKLDKKCIHVKLDTGKEAEVTPDYWTNIKYEFNKKTNRIEEKVIGKLIQYPLRLAWAITVHKSQGMTFSKVHLDFTHSPFTHGQTYVAISRCQTIQGISLTRGIYPNDILLDQKIVEFSNRREMLK